MALEFAQIYAPIAGGIVGGFAGFVSNGFQHRMQVRTMKRHVARALAAEIESLSNRIEQELLVRLSIELKALKEDGRFTNQVFITQKDYGRVFQSQGQHIGYLPSELAKDLIDWYISLSVYQERSAELRELTMQNNPDFVEHTIEVGENQHRLFSDLVSLSRSLVTRLSEL